MWEKEQNKETCVKELQEIEEIEGKKEKLARRGKMDRRI